jgi:RimJ/RimL family protein N-acetyltransferase
MTAPVIVAADHPSLDRDVDRFLDTLRAEPRYFGPKARANPKPFPSLISSLRERGGFRLALVDHGEIVGLVRVDGAGNVAIAIGATRRGEGLGTQIGRAALERALKLHYPRLVIRSTKRSTAVRRLGEQLGCVVVESGRGRTDLILDLRTDQRTA